MIYLLTTIHVFVCLFLIVVVLLQSGKAADLAGAFGGMGSQTAFGPRGSATILSKATTISAVAFMITSLSLSVLATRNARLGSSALDKMTTAPVSSAPAAPAPGQKPAAPGAMPSVTLTPEGGGPSKTIPLQINPDGSVSQLPAKDTPAAPAPPANAPAKK
ncbi:MAG: preprotein translocase subunit SecG [Bryobacterales bacterium]|nr:preprotein translocase subunit SecG [Bryobacterales bacterium]